LKLKSRRVVDPRLILYLSATTGLGPRRRGGGAEADVILVLGGNYLLNGRRSGARLDRYYTSVEGNPISDPLNKTDLPVAHAREYLTFRRLAKKGGGWKGKNEKELKERGGYSTPAMNLRRIRLTAVSEGKSTSCSYFSDLVAVRSRGGRE